MAPEEQAQPGNVTAADAGSADAIAALRDEFSKKFEELKAGNAELVAAKDSEIAKLTQEVTDLRAEVVRSATIPQPKPEEQKTEEEIYNDEVNIAAEVTLNLMKNMS